MKIAFLKSCPKCKNFWHVVIDNNPCYDTCPHCKTQFRVTVEVRLQDTLYKSEHGYGKKTTS